MKIRVWFHLSDGGDGSVGMEAFKTRAEAEAAAEQEMEDYGQALDENVKSRVFDVSEYEQVI